MYKSHPNFCPDFLVWDYIEIILISHPWKDAPLVWYSILGQKVRLTWVETVSKQQCEHSYAPHCRATLVG